MAAWEALLAELNSRNIAFVVLDIDTFNSLDSAIQESIHSAVLNWVNSQMMKALSIRFS